MLHEKWPVVGMFGEVQQRAGRPPEHVQAGAHRVGIVAQEVDPVLVGHTERGLFGLLDERHQVGHAR